MKQVQESNKTEYKLSVEERETYMWYSEIDKKWLVETSVRKHINKFRKMGWTEVEIQKYRDGSDYIVKFEAPEFAVSVRKPVKRFVSDERKLDMAERMKNYQNSKKLSDEIED